MIKTIGQFVLITLEQGTFDDNKLEDGIIAYIDESFIHNIVLEKKEIAESSKVRILDL